MKSKTISIKLTHLLKLRWNLLQHYLKNKKQTKITNTSYINLQPFRDLNVVSFRFGFLRESLTSIYTSISSFNSQIIVKEYLK